MSDFSVRSDNVDVEQIMRQIRAPHPREARRRLHRRGDPRAGERQAREVHRSERGPLEPARGVPPRQHAGAAGAELRVRRRHALRNAPRADPLAARAVPSVPEAAVQSQPADPGAAHPVGAEPEGGGAERPARAARRAALRGDPQPRRRAHAHRRRGEEPEDAARVDGEPPRFRRAPRARARRRRAVSPRRRRRRSSRRPARIRAAAISGRAIRAATRAARSGAAIRVAGQGRRATAPARGRRDRAGAGPPARGPDAGNALDSDGNERRAPAAPPRGAAATRGDGASGRRGSTP